MSDSHAYLSALNVIQACEAGLDDIKRARTELEFKLIHGRSWIAQYVHSVAPWFYKPTDTEADIVARHRAGEEGRMIDIANLALAAYQEDESFRVYISIEDFRYLKPFWSYEKCSGQSLCI